jgi:hypothetical protein
LVIVLSLIFSLLVSHAADPDKDLIPDSIEALNGQSGTPAEALAKLMDKGINYDVIPDHPYVQGQKWRHDPAFMDDIVAQGFQSVRIFFTANSWVTPDIYQPMVDDALERGLAVVLCMWGQAGWDDGSAQSRAGFVAKWEEYAEEYKDAKYTDKLCFELLNEPGGMSNKFVQAEPRWLTNGLSNEATLEYHDAAIPAIRAIDPNRVIAVGGGRLQEADLLKRDVTPANLTYSYDGVNFANDTRLIGAFHMYEPYSFSHSSWRSLADTQALTWPTQTFNGKTWEGVWEGTKTWKEVITFFFDEARDWMDTYNKPTVLTEWGAWYGSDNPNHSHAEFREYLEFIVDECAARGIGQQYYTFGWVGGKDEFNVYSDRPYNSITNKSGTWDTVAVEILTEGVIVEPGDYILTVIGGSGGGMYNENIKRTITAGNPPAGQLFDQWTGDVAYVEDVNSATTKVTMPAGDVTVTANYKNAPPSPAGQYEAETATLNPGSALTIQSSQPGFSGSGYVNYGEWTDPVHYVEFSVNVDEAKIYEVSFRYSTTGWRAEKNSVVVNGTVTHSEYDWPHTNDAWSDLTLDLALIAGSNSIRVEKFWGAINLDYVFVYDRVPSLEDDDDDLIPNDFDAKRSDPNNAWQDEDRDGMVDLLEYATASNPSVPDSAFQFDSDMGELTVRARLNLGTELRTYLSTSSDLENWNRVALSEIKSLEDEGAVLFVDPTVDGEGVQTSTITLAPDSDCYFRLELESGAENSDPIGPNMLTNGDFENANIGPWEFFTAGASAGSASVSAGQAVLAITATGSAPWEPQFVQSGLKIESGTTYVLSFDASASAPRSIAVEVNTGPDYFEKFLKVDDVALTGQMKTYTYTFTASQSDADARLDFNVGGVSSEDVYIDEVVLAAKGPTD